MPCAAEDASGQPRGESEPTPKRRRRHSSEALAEEAPEPKRPRASAAAEEATSDVVTGAREFKAYVGSLPFNADEEAVHGLFLDCGEIADLQLLKTQFGKSRGIAFVAFENKTALKAALKLDGADFRGRPLKVSKAQGSGARPAAGAAAETKSKARAKAKAKDQGDAGFRREGAEDNNEREIFVGSLPHDAKEQAVRLEFEKYGVVDVFRMPVNRKGLPKGYAFITYNAPESLAKALERNGTEYEGRVLVVRRSGDAPAARPDEAAKGGAEAHGGSGKGKAGKGGKAAGKGKDEGKGKKGKASSSRAFEVFVGGLPWDVEAEMVRKDFAECGEIERFSMPLDAEGQSKGIAFVNYTTLEAMEKALGFHEQEYCGMTIRVLRANAPRGRAFETGQDARSTAVGEQPAARTPPPAAEKKAPGAAKRRTFSDSDEE